MDQITLPQPNIDKSAGLAETLNKRKSHRSFRKDALDLTEISQILWAGLGLKQGQDRGRTWPSAGACYPLELFVCVGPQTVNDLDAGLYLYDATGHTLRLNRTGDFRSAVARAALEQSFIGDAPLVIVVAAAPVRTTSQYGGERGMRYVYMDAGHVGQNIYLQATALGLGTVAVGAFRDSQVLAAAHLPPSLKPLYIMPVGHPA
ncbi:SagB/ThcOx family dehydrogenase [Acidobacteriota bacterium]